MTFKHPIKHLFILLLTGTSLFISPLAVFSETVTKNEGFSINAKSALAVDVETGKILYEQNSDEVLPVASITKLLSFYVIQQKIADGEISWTDTITISPDVAALSQNLELSNVRLHAGDTYTVEELFETAVILSANASTVALAAFVAGTEADFVDLMKEQLQIWGITDFKLVNSTGLNNEDLTTPLYPSSGPTDENEFNAKDLAIITRHLIQSFPKTLEYTQKASATFESKSDGPAIMYSTNWLLPGMPYEKPGVDGLKTGTTILAGASFVGTSEQEGQRIITVILNAETSEIRFMETSRLMDYAYENWTYQTIVAAGEEVPVVSPMPVLDGKEKTVPVIVKEVVTALVPHASKQSNFEFFLTFDDKKKATTAPITTKKALGQVKVSIKDETLGYLEKTDLESDSTPFYAANEVQRANLFVRLWRQLFN